MDHPYKTLRLSIFQINKNQQMLAHTASTVVLVCFKKYLKACEEQLKYNKWVDK